MRTGAGLTPKYMFLDGGGEIRFIQKQYENSL